jgi:mRNA interferase MazF
MMLNMTTYELGEAILVPFPFAEITDWSVAGLIKPSMIKPVLTTLEKNLVIRKLGKLQEADHQALKHLLLVILG